MSKENNILKKEYTLDQTIRETIAITTNGKKLFADRLLTLEKLLLTGVVKSYNQGNLISSEEYKNGQLSGTTKYFHSNGKLFIAIEFKNDPNSSEIGYKDGKYITYDEEGEIEEVRFYRKNIETRPRQKISKQPIQNKKLEVDSSSEKSIPFKSIPDSAVESYEWNYNPNQKQISRLGENYSQKTLNPKNDQNDLFKQWVFGLISFAIIVAIISMIVNFQNTNIKSNYVKPLRVKRNSSYNISAKDSLIDSKAETQKKKVQSVKINNKIKKNVKPNIVKLKIDTVPIINDTVKISIDSITVVDEIIVDSTSIIVLKLFNEKDSEKNVYRSIRKELKKKHGIKLSVKEIKQIIDNSTDQN